MLKTFSLAIILAAGCTNPTVKTVKTSAINCAEAQVASTATALLPSVADLLQGNKPDWKSNLSVLTSALGAATLCAVDAAVKAAESKISNVDVAAAAPPPPVVKNGRKFLADQHVTLTK